MRIVFYGRLADAFGRELEIETASPCSIMELRSRIIEGHPHAKDALLNKRVRICIGDILVDDDYVVSAADSVEFLAPVSGG